MRLIYLPFLLLCWFNSLSQGNSKFSITQSQVDSLSYNIKSILLIGMGSTTTKIFLDDLSNSIIKEFAKNNVIANYYFLGKTPDEAKSSLNTIDTKRYNAILFFFPKGSSFFEAQGGVSQVTIYTRLGAFTPIIASSGIKYEQDFDFQLCITDQNMKRIWSASVEVSCDLSKPKTAKKVGDKVLSFFKLHKYLK